MSAFQLYCFNIKRKKRSGNTLKDNIKCSYYFTIVLHKSEQDNGNPPSQLKMDHFKSNQSN